MTFHEDDGGEDQAPLKGYDTIRGQAVAKNPLVVGAIVFAAGSYQGPGSVLPTPYTNWGPTDDGRIKPDLVALGEGIKVADPASTTAYHTGFYGTSAAAPIVTGTLGLLGQFHGTLHPTWRPLWGSTYKALLIHTAREAGATGPDYQTGWGLLDAHAAATLMQADAASDSRAHIKEVTLNDGDSIAFSVVAAGTSPLKVTICWTDPAHPNMDDLVSGSARLNPTIPVLVNNLDLRVNGAPDSRPWSPDPLNPTALAAQRDNAIDNVEQFMLPNPGAGTFQVSVTSNGTIRQSHQGPAGSQRVSIIVSGNVAQPNPAFEITEAMINPLNPAEMLLQWNSVVGQTYRIKHFDPVTAPSSSWQTLQTISASHEVSSAKIAIDLGNPQRFVVLQEDN